MAPSPSSTSRHSRSETDVHHHGKAYVRAQYPPGYILDWPTMREKQQGMAKWNAHRMGISPRALGRAATMQFDLGLRRARIGTLWNDNDERRRAAAVPPRDPATRERAREEWDRAGAAPCMMNRGFAAASTYGSQEEELTTRAKECGSSRWGGVAWRRHEKIAAASASETWP